MNASIYLGDESRPSSILEEFFIKQNWELSTKPVGNAQLVFKSDRLVWHNRAVKLKPLEIDFLANWKQLKLGKQDVFAKAIGVRLGVKNVVDTTAGLGRDTIKLLKLGCEVVSIERSAILYALLLDAKIRAEENSLWLERVRPRFKLLFGQAEESLSQLSMKEREVIYLDPMFPEKDKTALAKGEMQHLQALFGEASAVDSLLALALEFSQRRVVLKRPRLANDLSLLPDQVFEGQSVRYDVWLKS